MSENRLKTVNHFAGQIARDERFHFAIGPLAFERDVLYVAQGGQSFAGIAFLGINFNEQGIAGIEAEEDRAAADERLVVGVDLHGQAGEDLGEELAFSARPLEKGCWSGFFYTR